MAKRLLFNESGGFAMPWDGSDLGNPTYKWIGTMNANATKSFTLDKKPKYLFATAGSTASDSSGKYGASVIYDVDRDYAIMTGAFGAAQLYDNDSRARSAFTVSGLSVTFKQTLSTSNPYYVAIIAVS